MPTETSRKRSVHRIYAPNTTKGDKSKEYIPLKVTNEITFKEDVPPGQEWIITFDNSPESSRKTHTVNVGSNAGKDDKLKVEFVDSINTEETTSKQEAIWAFLGNSQNPPVHLKTYKKKIYKSDENGNITDKETWIEVERIKSIEFRDERDNPSGQEYVWTLKHPDEEDPSDDYIGVKNAMTDWDFTTINPPYRIDPFQTIVDAQFQPGYMLVLYGTKNIAAVKVSKEGKFTLVSKKTLVSSSWSSSNWDSWFNAGNKPSFFLNTVQIKVSKTFHMMSCPIKVQNGVISVPSTLEQRPVYNVADTLHKYAESSTPITDSFGSAFTFGPFGTPVMNGKGNIVYNEYGDKFEWAKSIGVRKVSSTTDDFPRGITAFGQLGYMSAVDTTGGRWGAVYSYNHQQVNNNGTIWPWTTAQDEAFDNFYASFPRQWHGPFYTYFYGPTNSGFTGVYTSGDDRLTGSGSCTVTTKASVWSKSGGLDVITPAPFTVTFNWTYNASTLYRFETDYNGISVVAEMNVYPNNDIRTFSFPYANGSQTTNRFYVIGDWYPAIQHIGKFTYHTPYESWENNLPYDTASAYYDPFYCGWLQVSDGEHLIQGYLKNGQKRIFMDGKEAGSKIAAAIGCGLEDIVTLFLGVKMSDINKLK